MLASTFVILIISGMVTLSAGLGVFSTTLDPRWIVANLDSVKSEDSTTIGQVSVRPEVEQIATSPNAINLSPDLITEESSRTENVVMSMTHPTITIDPRVVEPGKTIIIIGHGFLANSQLDMRVGKYVLEPLKTSMTGSLGASVQIPDFIAEGQHKLEISDTSGGTASHELIIKSFKEKLTMPDDSIRTIFTTDFFPPVTTVTIEGSYNSLSGWYYGNAPIATFTATDEFSAVKAIHVNYERCGYIDSVVHITSQCVLKSGDSITLDKQTKAKGYIIFDYFAIDNEGHKEEPKILDILYDGHAPELYVMKIFSQTQDNIVIPKCKDRSTGNCIPTKIEVNEQLTFQTLSTDRISGSDTMQARVIEPLSLNVPWIEVTTENGLAEFPIVFSKKGIWLVEVKGSDIAGNESETMTFLFRVT